MWEPAGKLPIKRNEKALLRRWVKSPTTAQRTVLRSRIVLAATAGHSNSAIAREVGVSRPTVIKWRRRFAEEGTEGLTRDLPRPGGGNPRLSDAMVKAVIEDTLRTKPKGATHWSTRSMAAASGLSSATVSRIWRAFALQPHRDETFKLSKDPLFIEKVRDIVGLYLSPPERAVVLCVDEKSQIQALDRTQPVLALRPGTPQRRTYDYQRNGVTSLFAALNVATGEVIGKCYRRHRAIEFKKFLALIDKAVPPELEVHLVLDNYGTHKTAMIHNWLARRPRFHLHFTPTSASWLNQVERWFAEITRRQIRRGSYRSTLALGNKQPKPSCGPRLQTEFWNPFKVTAIEFLMQNIRNSLRLWSTANEFEFVWIGDRYLRDRTKNLEDLIIPQRLFRYFSLHIFTVQWRDTDREEWPEIPGSIFVFDFRKCRNRLTLIFFIVPKYKLSLFARQPSHQDIVC